MAYAIKAAVADIAAAHFAFEAAKTMYGGKQISVGDTIYLFASENEGGRGLFARGAVTRADAVPLAAGIARQTPRVSIAVRVTGRALRPLGRLELKPLKEWGDDQPGTELNFKFYRQATDKIVGLSDEAAAFLETFF
ncbi:hypothetical protein LB518_04010 [Mesorhizobium sp. BR1-1-16]|uniref:hypothetical protein n=1 Tax=Mesorhizobium sp. BR1-1-16 TaxID=2876653 RepID=UPI001CCEF9E3|nr:hypothetical protein [Mesorhizobium sp. BR1-1-16]MBZ9935442.1 hypothetical protein [Mesorhizobium sp. BR1-1-16]